MADRSEWLIYGATGYTGRRIAQHACRQQLKPIVAGRRADAVQALAQELGCEGRHFLLDHPKTIANAIRDVKLVLNCAGPFSQTAEPLIKACIASSTHYLDITGEYAVIEQAAQLGPVAAEKAVAIVPAVGFDVVVTDCLAIRLHRAFPEGTHLELAFTALQRISRGTAKTVIEGLARGGVVRQNGRLRKVPLAWRIKKIDFPSGRRWAMSVPWGDVVSAWYSTGVPNIVVYIGTTLPAVLAALWVRLTGLAALSGNPVVQACLKNLVDLCVKPPTENSAKRISVWGRLTGPFQQTAEASLQTPGGYTTTVHTAVECVRRVLHGQVSPGFHTPGTLFGTDLLESIPGLQFRWIAKPR